MLFTIFWVVLAVILFALVVTSGLFYFLKKRIYAIDSKGKANLFDRDNAFFLIRGVDNFPSPWYH